MDQVYIKYNPYRVTTEIKINDQAVKQFSKLNIGDKRLQEWIDNLPTFLYNERNTKKFEIIFYGTDFDYEDVKQIAEEANKKYGFNISLTHIHAKKIKPKAITEIFNKIQKGPFDELKAQDVKRAFQLAISKEFEVNVIATMSAGKSTLINALLGQKLMPARREATTATITRIKDNDRKGFIARAYNESGKLIQKYPELTYQKMNDLNNNSKVCAIDVEGDIPFVSSDEVSLVLIDTPGPNSARNPQHRVTTYKMLSDSSKSLVLYVLNANQSGITDDSKLLNYVARNMQVNGKQSRDRFIFVLNQLDEFWPEEDDIKGEINKTRQYLENKGIHNPNIYPLSAKTALNIRTVLKNVSDMTSDDCGQEDIEDAKKLVRRSVNIDKLHLEENAPVPNNVQSKIKIILNEGVKKNDLKQQSLVHSGIISLEEGIKLYVEKYSTPLKIKTISDLFLSRVKSAQTFERLKDEISKSEDKKKEIETIIYNVRNELNNGDKIKEFRKNIASLNSDKIIDERVTAILAPVNKKVREVIQANQTGELTVEEAENQFKKFAKLAIDLQAEVVTNLEDLINNEVISTADQQLKQYKTYIESLTDGIQMETVDFKPFDLVEGCLPTNAEDFVNRIKKEKTVDDGYEFYIIPRPKLTLNLFKWFYDKKTKKVSYVDAGTLATTYFNEVQEELFKSTEQAKSFAKEEIEKIKMKVEAVFSKVNTVLEKKMSILEHYIQADGLKQEELDA